MWGTTYTNFREKRTISSKLALYIKFSCDECALQKQSLGVFKLSAAHNFINYLTVY